MMAMDFTEYLQFRDRVDEHTRLLSVMHTEHMKCGKGCDLCCVDFSIFPLEFYAIRAQIEKEYPRVLEEGFLPPQEPGRCAFLKNHSCSIYGARPYICRTHGFPLLNMDESGEDWELSFCELNFTHVEEDYFDEGNVMVQDAASNELFVLNRGFLAVNPIPDCDDHTLLPMSDLLKS